MKIHIAPLTVNKAWQGRRFKTKEYKDWQELFLYEIRKHKIKKIKGDVIVNIEWGYKFAKSMDIDNPIKLILDRLVEAGFIEDDRKIWRLIVDKRKCQNPYIKIKITKI